MIEAAAKVAQGRSEASGGQASRAAARPAQYKRQSEEGRRMILHEGGHQFEVNLTDYLDTGLFLDHRITRGMVEKEAAGKRFLNLFGYTGAFTVYAAAGGAAETTTVDLSSTYSQWAERNLRLNGFIGSHHQVIQSDVMRFLRRMIPGHGGEFDLAVVDPPTFSNSKNTPNIWDVDRDHVELLNLVIERSAPGGKIYFSTNFRKFKFRGDEILGTKSAKSAGRPSRPIFATNGSTAAGRSFATCRPRLAANGTEAVPRPAAKPLGNGLRAVPRTPRGQFQKNRPARPTSLYHRQKQPLECMMF